MANSYDLSGRVALVTGALGGLGPAVVRALIESGAVVVAVARSASGAQVESLRTSLGQNAGQLDMRAADVLKEDEVQALVEGVVSDHGRLDIAVNLVGGYDAGQPVTQSGLDVWRKMLDLNLHATVVVSKYAGQAMQRAGRGRILNVASRAAYSGRKNAAAYAVSKSSVITLTQAQAEELKDAGVTVNAVVPSIFDTAANRASMPGADYSIWPKPEDIARVLLFLASDDAWLISGAAVPVYGRA